MLLHPAPWRTCGLSFGPFGATAAWRGFQVGAARVLIGLDDDLWCKTQFWRRVKPDSLEVKHGKTKLLWGKHTYFHEVKHIFYWVQHNFYGNLSRWAFTPELINPCFGGFLEGLSINSPSGNQTWLAGQSTIKLVDRPTFKPPFIKYVR